MTDSAALPSAPLPLVLRTEVALADRAPGDRPALESQVCPQSGRVTTVCPPELLTMAGSDQLWRFQARALQALLSHVSLMGGAEAEAAIAPSAPTEVPAPEHEQPVEPVALAPDPLPEDPVLPVVAEAIAVCAEDFCPTPMPVRESQPEPPAIPDWFATVEPLPEPLDPGAAVAVPPPEAQETVQSSEPEQVAPPDPEPLPKRVAGVDPQAATVVVGGVEPMGAPWQIAARPAPPAVPVEAPLPWADAAPPVAAPESALPAWMTDAASSDGPAAAPLPWAETELPTAPEAAFPTPDWMSGVADGSALDLPTDLFAELDLQGPVDLPDLEPDPLADLELPPLLPKG